MGDASESKNTDTKIETASLSFVEGSRAYHSLQKQNQQRTRFLLDSITSGALKHWSREIEDSDRAHDNKQRELVDAGGTPEWRRTLHDVSLDTNGLFIRLGSHNHGIHAHIPYSSLTSEIVAKLFESSLISQDEMFELLPIKQASAPHLVTQTASMIFSNPGTVFGQKRHVTTDAIKFSISEQKIADLPFELQNRSARIAKIFSVAEHISNGTFDGKTEEYAQKDFGRTNTQASISKQLYENRSGTVRDPRMYEAIKILKVLLAIPKEERVAMGIHFVRGHFVTKKDRHGYEQVTECIGMYSPHGFHRIFIDPDKHLGHGQGKTPERDLYDALPVVSHKDFAAVEAAMLPFSAFLRASRFATFGSSADIPTVEKGSDGVVDPKLRVRALRAVRKLRSIIVTEVPEESYRALTIAVHTATQHIRKGTFTREKRKDLEVTLTSITEEYANYLTSRDPLALINELLAAPVRIDDIVHDASFLEKLPKHLQDYAATKDIKPEDFASGARTTVVSALRGDVGYAREAQMWRALKLERRPTLLYTSGASFSPNDPAALAKERIFARNFVELAFRYNAIVFVPGTATHSSRILAEEYNRKLSEKCGEPLSKVSLEERQKQCRFVFFEPGGSLIFPGNEHMPKEGDLRGAHFAVALDGATTGHTAGWSGSGDNDVSYNRHIHARQVNMNTCAEGLTIPVLARNGGKWSAVEHQFASYDNLHILAMKDSGRHSSLLAHIQEESINDKPALDFFAQQDTLDSFIDSIRDFVTNHDTLSQDKDLYEDVFGARSKSYLPELFELLQSIEPGNLVSVDDSSYLNVVEGYFKAHKAQIASENT